jgi:hypothetical protein
VHAGGLFWPAAGNRCEMMVKKIKFLIVKIATMHKLKNRNNNMKVLRMNLLSGNRAEVSGKSNDNHLFL